MGAEREREDTDPTAKAGTEPGLGPGSDPNTATIEDDMPPPVDFDALHAALGDPLEFDELPPAAHEIERGPEPHGGDSSGRSSATYASSRPHTIPPTRAPAEDLNAPAVIVAAEALDTVPSAPPQMTIPVRAPPVHPNAHHGAVIPNHAPPSSGPHPAAAANFTATPPHGMPAQRHVAHMTVRMPERPINPRRPKTPTVVVRARGPSTRQKLVAFAAMLMLFTACGIAVVIWQRPAWVGLEPEPRATVSAAPAPSGGVAPTTATTTAPAATTATPSPTASAVAPTTTAAPPPSATPKKIAPKPNAPAPATSLGPSQRP